MNPITLPALSPAAVEGLRALLTIIESGLASAPPPPAAPRRMIQEVGNELLVSKARTGKSLRYVYQLHNTLTHLFAGRMLRPVQSITGEELEAWANAGNLAARTKRNRITNARIFFEFALRRGYVGSNPAAGIELPRLENKPAAIMPPDDVAKLLATAHEYDPDVMRIFALQFFAGLRTSEAVRICDAEIGARYVEVKAEKCKTRRRRLVTIQPVLRAWLDAGGRLPMVDVHARLLQIKRFAGVPFPANAARHSFCSYHYAHFGSAAQTAMQAGHSEAMLFAHYRELVTPEAAAAFWEIKPPSVQVIPSGRQTKTRSLVPPCALVNP